MAQPQPQPVTGTVLPKYLILTALYAPPGTQSGKGASSVSYGSGSSTGVTTSSKSSFNQSYSVTASGGGGFLGSVSASASFSYGRNAADSSSIDLKKSATTTISASGPAQNGIDHDRDLIYLWLNPKVSLTLAPSSAAWTFAGDSTADIQYLYVGWLKNPTTMPPGVIQALTRYGITAADFPDIVQQDQLAAGNVRPASPRFQSLRTTFPYEPPYSASDPVPSYSFSQSSSDAATTGTEVSDNYKVGLTISVEASFLGLAKAGLKTDDSWTWTNTSSTSNTAGSTQTAQVTVTGPSFGYQGSTDMEVFYDAVYKTFAFSPVDTTVPLAFKGRLLASNGTPAPFQRISAVAGGVTYHTFSNSRGEYRFAGQLRGPVTVKSGSKVLATCARSRPLKNFS